MVLLLLLLLLSCVWIFAALWTAARQASLYFTISQSLLKLMTIESMMPSNQLILCRPFSCPRESSPALGSFPMSLIFASGGQSIGASTSASVFPKNIQSWFPLGLTGLISFLSKGLSRVFSYTTVWKLQRSAFFMVQLSHPYVTAGKTIALTVWTFVRKLISAF